MVVGKGKKKNSVKRRSSGSKFWLFMRLFMGAFSFVGVVAAALLWMLNAPLERSQDSIDAHISTGMGARSIAQELQVQGLMVDPNLFVLAARVTDADNKLKAGRYEIPDGISTFELVEFLSKGKGVLSSVTLVEGFTSNQLLKKLRSQSDLVDDLATLTDSEIASQFQLPGNSLEGWLYPDTYRYAPGSKLSELLTRAIRLQKEELNKAWGNRARDLPLKNTYEALILASIIEKETGQAIDRPKIASVFVNRLNRGMLLQTDPTVIYGVENFDGNLTRKHLNTDTPYNTYTRPGLPPTPIANPGKASLYAAVRPESTNYLYFVAKGNGESYFSKSLREHNNAVRRYQLRK